MPITPGIPAPTTPTAPFDINKLILNNWTNQSITANTELWADICWSPQRRLFVAVAMAGGSINKILTSPNGINWTLRNTPTNNVIWRNICWSAERNLFVIVGQWGTNNGVMTSSDGINWTLRTPALNLNWIDVCWSPKLGIFVAT